MGYKIGELFWKIEADTTDFDKGAKKTETTAKGMGKSLTAVGKVVTAGFTVAIVAGLGKVSKELINAASAAEESANAVNVVFGEAASGILDFSGIAVESVGLSSTAFQSLATVTGSQLKTAGVGVDELSGQVIDLTTRAADVASVFNTSVDDALMAFNSALRGEAEPARRFAVNLSDAAVQAEALASGMVTSKSEITDAIKVQARYNIILKQTDGLAGDFANTQDSFSNQVKIAESAVDNLKDAMGVGLLPIATESVSIFGDLTMRLTAFIAERNRLKAVEDAAETGTGAIDAQIDGLTNQIAKLREITDNRAKGFEAAKKYGRELNSLAVEQQKNDLAEIKAIQNKINGLRLEAQAIDTNNDAKKEAAEKVQEEADAQIKANNELQAYLDLVNSEYAETQQGKIDALAEEIALWETYAETAVETAPQVQAILEERREEYKDLTEASEEFNESASDGLTDALDIANAMWASYFAGLSSARRQAITEQQEMANAIIASTNFWATESAAVVDALYAYELGALDAKLNNQEISEEEYNIERNKILKKQAIADKVVSLFEIGINTASNIVESYPNPFLMAAAGILGAAQAGLVAATPIPSFETGGIVPGTSFSGDNVAANVNSGEMILNRSQQAELFKMANNGGGGNQTINIQLDKKTIATAVVSAVNAGQGGVISQRVVK